MITDERGGGLPASGKGGKRGEGAEVSHALSLSLSLSHVAWNNYITVAAAEEEENYYRNNAQHPPLPP